MNRIAIGIGIFFALLSYTIISVPDPETHTFDLSKFALRIIGDIALLLFLSAILNAIISLFPFKTKKYKDKFKRTLPSVFLILTIIVTILSATWQPEKYADIIIPPNLDCSSLKQGEFICNGVLIKRYETRQTEIVQKTGKADEFTINWLSDCEYELIGIHPTTANRKVKIIEISPVGHKVYLAKFDEIYAYSTELKNK